MDSGARVTQDNPICERCKGAGKVAGENGSDCSACDGFGRTGARVSTHVEPEEPGSGTERYGMSSPIADPAAWRPSGPWNPQLVRTPPKPKENAPDTASPVDPAAVTNPGG